MIKNKIYLAGPISGLTYEQSTTWVDSAVSFLAQYGIHGYSPMRGDTALKDLERPITVKETVSPLGVAAGINVKDRFDVKTSGVVLANLLGAENPSFGTVTEIAWAKTYDIPVILVIEDEGNVHDHPMVWYETIRVNTLEKGLELVKLLMLPDIQLSKRGANDRTNIIRQWDAKRGVVTERGVITGESKEPELSSNGVSATAN